MLSFGHFDGTRADAPHASGAAKAPGVASPPNRHAAERCAAHAREDAKLSGQHATARQANTLLTDREREAECTSGATGAALRGLQRQWFWPWFWPLGSCLFLDTLKPPTNSRGGGASGLFCSLGRACERRFNRNIRKNRRRGRRPRRRDERAAGSGIGGRHRNFHGARRCGADRA